jgi:GT2 family glycosyltransferase
LSGLIDPPVQKPLKYVEYNKTEAEHGGNKDDEDAEDCRLVLIRNGSNSGFSAGNNTGIRYALKKNADYTWLLNNDTLVTADTMSEMVCRMEKDEKVGLVGSVIYFAENPLKMQTYGGGKISILTGRDRFVYEQGEQGELDCLDYITGTSLFVRNEVFERVGLLDESFFFYWEDVDFSRRVLKAGWKLGVAEDGKVYHRFSASVGGQSLKSDLYKVGSLVRYHRKHFKIWWVVPVTIHLSAMVLNRVLRRQFDRVGPILREWFK